MQNFPKSLILLFALPAGALCSAVTFVTSLPVARDQIVVRFNLQPSFSTRQLNTFQFPVSVAYGLTSKLGLFANLSQGFASIDTATPTGAARLLNGGSGDTGFYARYTLYKIDKPNSTFRVTPLAGFFIPTGGNTFTFQSKLQSKSLQFGSGTVDPYVGVAAGISAKRWTTNWDATYRLNPLTSANFSAGSELRLDGQAELKIWPITMPDQGLPHLVNLSLESNYYVNRKDHLNGVLSANSGGRIFRESALLQLSSLRWQVGGGIQIPLLQDLNGTGRVKQKVGYLVFFEYYLAAPVWRKHG
ncbi:MAG: hypothetical protein QOJ99_3121 [Bryobacterales bacterium]|nr:hypothetical protein [Bryobacterales bacterium]